MHLSADVQKKFKKNNYNNNNVILSKYLKNCILNLKLNDNSTSFILLIYIPAVYHSYITL